MMKLNTRDMTVLPIRGRFRKDWMKAGMCREGIAKVLCSSEQKTYPAEK